MPTCGYCNKEIDPTKKMTAINKDWCKDCFSCQRCSIKLFSFSKFFDQGGKPTCATCHAAGNPKCFICNKEIMGKFVTTPNMGGQKFHEDCFRCAGCGKKFGDEGFFEDKGKLWHLQCAKE